MATHTECGNVLIPAGAPRLAFYQGILFWGAHAVKH